MIGKPAIWALVAAVGLSLTALGTLAGGDATTTTKAETMTTAKTDTEALARFIPLETSPASVLWDTAELPGGSDWMLTALLTYSTAERDALLAAMAPQPGMFSITLPDWVPDQATTALGETDGTVQSDQTLAPTPFFKSPLLTGNALAVGDTQILIVLQTQ